MKNYLEERTKNLIKELRSKQLSKLEEIKKVSNTILEIQGVTKKQSTPIVKIIKQYNINVYKEKTNSGISALLLVNGRAIDIYGKEKVIIVSENEELYWKRYFAAIELGKYIFDFLCNDECNNNDYYYYQYEYKNHNDSTESERFAREILMPEHSFLRQYMIAMHEDSSRLFTEIYLSRFFEVPKSLIVARINEIINS